jgi:hypothetical protein
MLRLALAALLLAPATAHADTIVFQRDGAVWTMRPDGSGQRRVAEGQYAWPSQADDGTIVAVDAGGTLHRMSASGVPIGAPLPSPATNAGEDDAIEPPSHVRISPDGKRIAYDLQAAGGATTLWTPADATGLDFPGQDAGQESLVAPSWIGSDRLLLTRDVAAFGDTAQQFAVYTPGGGDDSAQPWFSSSVSDWASGQEGVMSRSGQNLAVLADDAPENEGVPTRVALELFSVDFPGGRAQFSCELQLPVTEAVEHTSPSFSPDGTRLAWAQEDGIHVIALSSGHCTGPERVLATPGAWEPYWSRAAETAPAPAAKLALRLTVAPQPHRGTVLGRGIRARVACSTACATRVTLRLDAATARQLHVRRVLAVARRRLDKTGATVVRLKLRRKTAKALDRLRVFHVTVRATAPGATPVSRVIRPY